MAKIRVICPSCGRALECDERHRKIKCAPCNQLIPLLKRVRTRARPSKRKWLLITAALLLAGTVFLAGTLIFQPIIVHWPDRRPLGVLFLASNYHSSATNPRGWFNDANLDVTGPNGPQRFHQALMDYADRSITILKRTGAQGAIIWDLEGEEFPHKTTYIGDPRMLQRLAPEMAAAADEFFARLRSAGLRVGLTIRPQQLVFNEFGQPRQTQVLNLKKLLLNKIDYARSRWGVTIFYLDSNGGIRRPDELWQLRRLMKERPDILLIPEHDYLSYWTFSAPYTALRKNDSALPARWARKLFPGSFQAMDIDDAAGNSDRITAAWLEGDVLLFRAWYWNAECQLMAGFAHQKP